MSGNGFALIAAVIKLISSFILQWQTSKDHENITNAEKDWKMELEKRELLQVLTPHGEYTHGEYITTDNILNHF